MKIHYLIIACLILVFPSCSKEVEDKECEEYFEANKEIITGVWDWFPYENGDHQDEFTEEDGSSVILTINRSERVIENLVGPIIKCPEVSTSPRLDIINNGDVKFSLWTENVQLNEGKAEASFVLSTTYAGSPLKVKGNIDNMHETGKTVEIDGTNYNDVIVFSLTLDSGEYALAVYLQKNIGVLGFEEEGKLSLLKG